MAVHDSIDTPPSSSECDSWSRPSTRPPSQAPSRAPSVSAGVSGNKLATPEPHQAPPKAKPPPSPQPSSRPRAPSSGHSDGGQKFTLKDLISSAPKLSRKSSARSTGSSKKSDSDGERRSVAGDSTASLAQKYGVCQKVAIGKGATSVVRLAHKWDRTEEKLYAVKVRGPIFITVHRPFTTCLRFLPRNSVRDERTNQRKNMSRNSPLNSAFPPLCTMSISSRPWISFRTTVNIGVR